MNRQPRKRIARSILEASARSAAENRRRHRRKGAVTAVYDRSFGGCRTKSVYETEESAIAAALRISVDFGPRSIYQCPDCGKWHLASPRPDALEPEPLCECA